MPKAISDKELNPLKIASGLSSLSKTFQMFPASAKRAPFTSPAMGKRYSRFRASFRLASLKSLMLLGSYLAPAHRHSRLYCHWTLLQNNCAQRVCFLNSRREWQVQKSSAKPNTFELPHFPMPDKIKFCLKILGERALQKPKAGHYHFYCRGRYHPNADSRLPALSNFILN